MGDIINSTEIVTNLLDKDFKDCFEIVTYNHYKFCDCHKEVFENYADLVLEDYKVQRLGEDRVRYFEGNSKATEKDFIAQRDTESLPRAYENIYDKALRVVAASFAKKGTKCISEKESVTSLVSLFANKYPNSLDDPIFVEVVKSVINHSLVVNRLKKITSNIGVYQSWIDKNGNERVSISPLLEAQREFDKIKVDALMVLDRKLNGEKKVNLNIDVDMTQAIIEVFNKRMGED